jgi:hypothetical protein
MTFTEANELLEQKSLTPDELTELREFVKELCDLIVEAMDDPPRLTPLAGKDWAERSMEAVS